jgi:hypothetical protein
MALWPWFEIRRLKHQLAIAETQLVSATAAYDKLSAKYQDMKSDEIVGELRRKVLEDKLAQFTKFDPDGDGKPGGKAKTKKKA